MLYDFGHMPHCLRSRSCRSRKSDKQLVLMHFSKHYRILLIFFVLKELSSITCQRNTLISSRHRSFHASTTFNHKMVVEESVSIPLLSNNESYSNYVNDARRSAIMTSLKRFSKNDTFVEYNRYGVKTTIKWKESVNDFQSAQNKKDAYENIKVIKRIFKSSFIPGGELSKDYFQFTLWRILQRFVSAICSVFGTQALLLALGVKQNKIGIAATVNWVLKDALGKFSRIFWASKNSSKFDSDAKKWRFRSSILYAIGNGLEIITYLFPSLFLLCAAGANALKQMAMLTSSATRNTIYKSFALSENIGDITAKGEAQIAVVDLVGMILGVSISRLIRLSKWGLVLLFAGLSVLDIVFIYQEIRSVKLNSINFERTRVLLTHYLEQYRRIPREIPNGQSTNANGRSTIELSQVTVDSPPPQLSVPPTDPPTPILFTDRTPDANAAVTVVSRVATGEDSKEPTNSARNSTADNSSEPSVGESVSVAVGGGGGVRSGLDGEGGVVGAVTGPSAEVSPDIETEDRVKRRYLWSQWNRADQSSNKTSASSSAKDSVVAAAFLNPILSTSSTAAATSVSPVQQDTEKADLLPDGPVPLLIERKAAIEHLQSDPYSQQYPTATPEGSTSLNQSREAEAEAVSSDPSAISYRDSKRRLLPFSEESPVEVFRLDEADLTRPQQLVAVLRSAVTSGDGLQDSPSPPSALVPTVVPLPPDSDSPVSIASPSLPPAPKSLSVNRTYASLPVRISSALRSRAARLLGAGTVGQNNSTNAAEIALWPTLVNLVVKIVRKAVPENPRGPGRSPAVTESYNTSSGISSIGTNTSAPIGVTDLEEVRASLVLPPAVASLRENVFKPTAVCEDVFQTWSSVRTDKELLAEFLSLFPKNSPFLISIYVREVRSWLEAWKCKHGLGAGGLLRSVRGKPVLIFPEVILHSNATQRDVFHSLLHVYFIQNYMSQITSDISVDDAGASLQLQPTSMSTSSSEYKKYMISLGLTNERLLDVMKSAIEFSKLQSGPILKEMDRVGWNTNKFLYGPIKARVSW